MVSVDTDCEATHSTCVRGLEARHGIAVARGCAAWLRRLEEQRVRAPGIFRFFTDCDARFSRSTVVHHLLRIVVAAWAVRPVASARRDERCGTEVARRPRSPHA